MVKPTKGTRRIRLVEETLRDGQLSLWATRMTTETMLGIAPTIDRAGFMRACVTSGAAFDTAVKFLYENPWERLRLLRKLMPQTELQFLLRGRNLIGWQRYPNDVVTLVTETIKASGMDWIMALDGLNDLRNIHWQISAAKAAKLKVQGVLFFALSPVHTDSYFAEKAKEFAQLGVDALCFYDASGLLTPQRTRSLIPRLRQAIGSGTDLELNAHCNTGLALECYVEAMRLGVDILDTAAMPLADGDSIPATANVLAKAQELGIQIKVDPACVRTIDAYFAWAAYKEDKPSGRHTEYDETHYRQYAAHQIPGGMMSNFVRQLTEAGVLHRLDEILQEVARVRQEIGYPPMVTPYSQFVGVQATMNVIEGERYKTVPQELRLYARGHYGELPAPIDPNVLDRILAGSDRSPIDPAASFENSMVERVRKERGSFNSDEDLVLSIFYDKLTLEKFHAHRRPIDLSTVPRTPLAALIKELGKRQEIASLSVETESTTIYARFIT